MMEGPYDKAFALNIQVCPFCQQRCDIEAVVCPHCTHTIPEEYRIINKVPDYHMRVLLPIAWFFAGLFVLASCVVMAFFDYFPNGPFFMCYFVTPIVGFIAECFHSILGVRRRLILVPIMSMFITNYFFTENVESIRMVGFIIWFLLLFSGGRSKSPSPQNLPANV